MTESSSKADFRSSFCPVQQRAQLNNLPIGRIWRERYIGGLSFFFAAAAPWPGACCCFSFKERRKHRATKRDHSGDGKFHRQRETANRQVGSEDHGAGAAFEIGVEAIDASTVASLAAAAFASGTKPKHSVNINNITMPRRCNNLFFLFIMIPPNELFYAKK